MKDEIDETKVVLARKSYDHLIRTRDRALREAEREREGAEHARRWALDQCEEQRRLTDRLNRVCYAAAALGVPIQVIDEALEDAATPPGVGRVANEKERNEPMFKDTLANERSR